MVSVLVVGLVPATADLPGEATTRSVSAARPVPTAAGADPAAVTAGGALLDRHAAALLRGDRAGWLTGLDPSAPALRARRTAVFDRLAALPVSSWRYRVLDARPLPGDPPAGSRAAALLHVRLSYRLAPDTRDLTREEYLTVAHRPGGWVLSSDRDGPTRRDLWDLGPVAVARGGRSLVIAADATADLAAGIADAVDAAVARVEAVWGAAGPRTVVVLVPADLTQFAALLPGTGVEALGRLAAVTTGPLAHDPRGRAAPAGTADRLVLNVSAYRALSPTGRRVVLTHEVTHVVTRAAAVVPAPAWLEEGLADYLGYLGTGLPARTIAGRALAEAAQGRLPTALPGADRFDSSRGETDTAYEQAWLACTLIAGPGPSRLVRFYREVTAIRPPPGAPTTDPGALRAVAFRDVLGSDEAEFVRWWRADLARRARG